FPAFDTVDTNHGIAQGLDGERLGELYGQLRLKNFVFTGAYGSRREDVPTASFGTPFNNHTHKERTTDRHPPLEVEDGRAFGLNRVTLRGSFDQFSYDGTYPFAGDDPESVLVARNSVLGSRWTAGVRLARPLPSRQTLTAGAEVIDNVHQDQQTHYVDPASMLF